MDTSEEVSSTPGRGLRTTAARQASEKKRLEDTEKKRNELKDLEKIEDDDLTNNQRKKIAKLRNELGIDATSKSVDSQSKPRYPESASGDIDEGTEKDSSNPRDHGDKAPPVHRNVSSDGGKQNGQPSASGTSKIQAEVIEEGRFAAAYCLCKSFKGNSRIVYGYGPRDDPKFRAKYEFGPSKAHEKAELEHLPLVSGTEESVMDIKKPNGLWKYGFHNIESVVNVATLAPNPNRKWKPRMTKSGKSIHIFPTMLVIIRWCNIEDNDKSFLKLQNGKSLNFRGNIMRRLKKKEKAILDEWIRAAAKHQDDSYKSWLMGKGIEASRPETFFPGRDWANSLEQSKKPRSQGAKKGHASKSPTVDGQGNLSKKRRREDSGTNSEPTKRSRHIPGSVTETQWIHYSQYIDTCKASFKLTDESYKTDPDTYKRILKDIEDGWEEYRQNMVGQGFRVLPGGEKPEAQRS